MPCISGNYNPSVGVVVQVAVLPLSMISTSQGRQNNQIVGQNIQFFPALFDTGASITCISNSVVKAVGLKPSGKTQMSGSTGQGTVNQYAFVVGLMWGTQQNPTGTFNGNMASHVVQGCEFTNHGFGFEVLLGRDIICKGVLTMSFDGHFVFAF